MKKKELWIGLASIVPLEGNNEFSLTKGIYVNIIALASSIDDYRGVINADLVGQKYRLIDIEDVETFQERTQKYHVSDELLGLAKQVQVTGKIGLGTFHTYNIGS